MLKNNSTRICPSSFPMLLVRNGSSSRFDDNWLNAIRNCQQSIMMMSNSSSSSNSNDTDRPSTFDEDANRLSPVLLLSFTIALALLITVGVVGNLLVIFALFRTRSHNATTTNAYILNLSIADLLFLIFCVPFQGTVYILNDWPFGNAMCKAAHYCQYYTMYASIWLLTTMSIDRYLAIGHPLQSVDWRSPAKATRICLCVWSISAIVSIPWLILYTTKRYVTHGHANVTACFDHWSETSYVYRKWLFFAVVLIGFVIPSTIIFCMAVLVARAIRMATDQSVYYSRPSCKSSKSKSRSDSNGSILESDPPCSSRSDGGTVTKRRRRVVYLVFALALVFVLCWLPHNFTWLWISFHGDIVGSMRKNYRAYFISKVIAHALTYVNSSINPILYSLASGQFRNRLAHALFGGGGGGGGGSYFQHTASNRMVRLGTLPTNNGQHHASHVGGGGGGGTHGRPKAGSFQPLLYNNDDGSRRSSRSLLNQQLIAAVHDGANSDETCFSAREDARRKKEDRRGTRSSFLFMNDES